MVCNGIYSLLQTDTVLVLSPLLTDELMLSGMNMLCLLWSMREEMSSTKHERVPWVLDIGLLSLIGILFTFP